MLSILSPFLAAKVAEPLFFKPLRFGIPEREKDFRSKALQGAHQTADGKINWFHLPGLGPRILFVHGWSGRGSQFAPLMEAASAKGADIYAFDAPGHGEEQLGRTDMLAFVRSIEWMNETFGPFHWAVGHSLGGMALWNALDRGLPLHTLVNIGSPASIEGVILDFVHAIGAREVVVDRMLNLLQKKYQIEPSSLSPVSIATKHPHLKGGMLHATDDGDVPLQHAEQLSAVWKQGQLYRYEGLGHRRILRDPEVINQCLSLLGV